MKTRIVMILMVVALYALPTMAQNMNFRSTSTMRGAGNYVAPVTAVGSTSAVSAASTTHSSNNPYRAKRGDFDESGEGGEGDEGSPIGDAVLPLAVMAVAFAGVVYYRRRKRSALND